jgi:phage terminase large subunit-like protein
MEHEPCFVGVDLASKIDLCALSFLFPPSVGRPKWRLIQRIWTPDETLVDRAHRDRAPYLTWVDQGWLTAVPGTSIDHDVVRQALVAGRDTFDIIQIGFDPWHAETPIKNLITLDGFSETQVIAVPQTYQGMSSACLRMQADILAGDIDARKCPVTAWAVSNTVDQRDGKDNMMFVKKKSRGRIDPVISATTAMSLALRQVTERPMDVQAEWI